MMLPSIRQNYTVQFVAMGTHIQAWLTVARAEDATLLQQVPAWFAAWEARFSRFRPDSELNQLNGYAGQWVSISAEMSEVIGLAIDAAAATDGLFNPLILPALIAAGYDRSFDQLTDGDRARAMNPVNSVAIVDWHAIDHDGLHKRVCLPPGAALDLGGIVKGWAAQKAADRLKTSGACLIDAGGDMAAHGSPDDSAGWQVGLPRTRDGSDILGTVVLTDQAIATSGVDHRHWLQADQPQHHLIDPRTSRPALTDARSATAIASSGVIAEIWAKVTLIAGTCDLAQQANVAALIVHQDLSLSTNALFEAQCPLASHQTPARSP